MKKKFMLMIVSILLCCSCNQSNKSTTTEGVREYTFLIYMNGSDLESENNAGTSDLYEMMKVGSDNNINIIIETGGTKDWKNYYIDASQNQRWMVQKNHLEKLESLGAKNMGQGETLKDFITWGIEKYPAKKYALILWNHGGGAISGFGYDEKFNYDTLLLVELKNALKGAYEITKTKFEIIGFDACLMASLETADIISPYGKYLVASTELEPSIGWEYSSFLQGSTDEKLNGQQLGTKIADGFFKAVQKQRLDEVATLSVIETGKVGEVKTNFESFLKKANKEIININEYNNLSKTISRSEYYGGQTQEEGFSNMIDLGDMANHLSSKYAEDKEAITSSIEEAMVYQVKGKSKENSSGISIYFPYYGKDNIAYELPIYKSIGFSESYNNFLQTYTDITSKDNESISTKQGISKVGDQYQVKVEQKEISYIKGVHAVLGKKVSEDKILLYGGSPKADLDESQGTVSAKFHHQWLTLNGHLMNFCITQVSEDHVMYSIPVILNDEYCNIKVAWYKEDTDSGTYHIIGAWHGVIPDNLVVRKEIIKIKRGDKIEPIYPLYDINSKQVKLTTGAPFSIVGEPHIELSSLETDEEGYVLGFCLDDCAQNRCFSEFIEIQ
ncbi:MAG: clostripain-related cysteine peptidase [Eubacteriales bacterium]